MTDKQTIKILEKMLEKYSLDKEEKEAVRNSIGMLSWSTLGETRIKQLGASRRKNKNL